MSHTAGTLQFVSVNHPLRTLFAALISTFLAVPCFAWNSTGHEIIAQIAYDRLSPGTRSAVAAILRNHPRLKQDLLHDEQQPADTGLAMFLRAATWPDMVRYPAHPLNRTENHPHWHFVDFPFDLDGANGPQPVVAWDGQSDPANLFQAMDKVTAQFKDPDTPPSRRAIDLCWIEHLAGDIHQPLHSTSLFSKEYPQGDQGGNLEMVLGNDDYPIPLHAYWDDVEGLFLTPDEVRKAADRIEAAHPASQLTNQIADLSVVDWAMESHAIALSVVYQNGTLPHATKEQAISDPHSVPALPDGYAQKALAAADVRMALAGYRLAAVVSQLIKS